MIAGPAPHSYCVVTPVTRNASAQEAPPIPMTTIVTAKEDIPVGTALTAALLATKEIPEADMPADAFKEPRAVEGLVVRRELFAGETVTGRDFEAGGRATSADILRTLQPGMRAMAVQVDQTTGVGTLIQPGDRVDVVLAISDTDVKYPLAGLDPTAEEGQTVWIAVDPGLYNGTSVKVLVQNVQVIGTLLPPTVETGQEQAAPVEGEAASTEAEAATQLTEGQQLSRRKSKRMKAFNDRLADTITLVANALRAGSSFLQAIEMVVRETQPPISTEFGRVIREVNLGLPFEEALQNMVRRVRSEDLELMTTAITVQHQVGGNLAEILDSIAFTIRERVRIKGEIKTLTAMQRMSGYAVGFMPVALMGVLFVIAPGFMDPMFQKPPALLGLPAGIFVLGFGAFMMAIGFLLIRRIVDIEV